MTIKYVPPPEKPTFGWGFILFLFILMALIVYIYLPILWILYALLLEYR